MSHPFRRHQWRPIKAEQGTFSFGGGMGTHVLDRCRLCGKVRTRTLQGWWSLADLTATNPAEEPAR